MLNSKGQLFSLDFILGALLMVFVLALVFQGIELNYYDAKEMQVDRELRMIGFNASERLLLSDEFDCDLVDSTGADLGVNAVYCLRTDLFNANTKARLGIPNDASCLINVGAATLVPGCDNAAAYNAAKAAGANIYSFKRKAFPSTAALSKAALMNCIIGNACTLNEADVTVSVWR